MPRYTFSDVKTGRRVEVELPMAQAPPIGALVSRGGRQLVRVADEVQAKTPAARSFVSRQLPRWYKHHRGTFDSQGRPQFDSMRRVRETCARAQGEEPHGGYDYD